MTDGRMEAEYAARHTASRSAALDERFSAIRNQFDRDDESESGRNDLDDERFELFRDSLIQSVLPDLPRIPGFHTCWLSTQHASDTIQKRLRVGYELIRKDEINKDFGPSTHTTGDYADFVTVKEMVAAKIPLRLYNRYMAEVHHRQPLEAEAGIRATVDQFRGELAERNVDVMMGDGTAGLGKGAKSMPVFTE